MKVYDQNLTGASSAGSSRTQETQRTDRTEGSKAGSSRSSSGDRVELSGALGSLARAMAAFGSGRAGKIQSLAAQYQNGSYQVDAYATSGGMVADALGAGSK
ncbi:MAG TPA: flagellar biosynthesis anti-sigma factor FlgM [Candidatus Sulfopaludibacter sp.]|nr:flagellar biosynthesis anti-sigma factor FlgM [Candidatus Sulfopaludibacter sp.]